MIQLNYYLDLVSYKLELYMIMSDHMNRDMSNKSKSFFLVSTWFQRYASSFTYVMSYLIITTINVPRTNSWIINFLYDLIRALALTFQYRFNFSSKKIGQ